MPPERSTSISGEDVSEDRRMDATELICASRRALQSEDWTRVREHLKELGSLLLNPEELKPVLDSELRALLQMTLVSGSANVATLALSVLTDSLQVMSAVSMTGENAALMKVLLKLIKLDVILVATSSEILVPAFEALTLWCSRSRAHRKMFLNVFPIDFLEEIYTRDCPLDVFTSYIELIASIIHHGKDSNNLLPTVLRIFARAVRDHGVGSSCEISETVCDALSNVFEDFEDENVVEEILDSRLASALVRHVVAIPTYISPGACVRTCLRPMMKLLVNLICSSEEHCERFIDQGVALAMEVSLSGQNPESCRFTCMALTNAFAYSSFSIEYALHSSLARILLQLRESPDQALRKEALRATSNFFSKASSAQIFSMIKMGYVPEIIKVLRSTHAEVISNGLLSLLAVIGATSYTDPSKLPALHELLSRHEVGQLTEVLRYHKIKEIRLAAIAVDKFMKDYLDGKKLGSGAIPRWSGITTEPTPSDLQSVMSLPM